MEFRILGPLEVSSEAGPISITAPKQRALLTHLLLHANEVVSADALIDALWGERPPASARKLLQVYVFQLRKSLWEETLRTSSTGYLIAVDESRLDSVRFEQLLAEGSQVLGDGNPALASALFGRALSLWRGPALADFAYDPLFQAEARRLEELRGAALEQRIEADLRLGGHDRLVGELQALVVEHPLRERLRAHLMLALYRSGRQAEAVDVYADARRTLVDELGVEPGRELHELERAILNQDPGLQPPPPEPSAAVALPTPSSRLIGRERELDEVERLLASPDVRLVTVTGPGGIGKTRLVLEAGGRVRDRFANGVVFVGLAALSDPGLVIPTIAETLGVKEQAGARLSETLAASLSSRELLLVLDNLEQVLEAAPSLADLLAAAPRLKLLGTSRARLRLSGEHVYLLPPLAVPEPTELDDLRAVSRSPAVALFNDRASAVRPGFVLTDENASAVAEICTRLEGVPLAIELASVRVRMLTPHALLDRLGRRLPLLTEGAWDLPARQQTLRATIDWSYELLSRAEQFLFVRLGVFVDGWTLETAELVCAPADVLETLTGLLDNSLVGHVADVDEPRYRMLETVREYALERLGEGDDAGQVRSRHAHAFAALAEQAEGELAGPDQAIWHERLEREHGNLRAALGWLQESEQAELELRLAAALGRFWYVRGHLSEGRRRLEDALAHVGAAAAPELRAKALRTASAIAHIQGEFASARVLAEQGLELYRLLDDRPGVVRSLSNLGAMLLSEGKADDAVSALDESVALSRSLPERRIAALALNNRGDVALTQGDYDAATVFFDESLALLREAGDTANIARSLFNLGAAALESGNVSKALELLRESVSMSAAVGDKEDVAWCLVGLAAVATQGGDPDRGAAVLGAADALLEGMGALMKPFERGLQGRTLASIRKRLDAASLDEAWARGRGLAIEQAVAYAIAEPV